MQDLDLKIYKETGLFLSVMSILNENWFAQKRWDKKTKEAVKNIKKPYIKRAILTILL